MASTTLFTYGPSNVDALLTTTRSVLAKSKDLLNDAIFNSIPLLRWLNKKTEVKRQGGASILVPLMFGKNSTFKAYNKDDVFDVTGQEGLTMAQYAWANYGGTIVLFGDEVRSNAGEGKLQDLVKAKTQQAVMSGRDRLAIDLFASSQDTKKISTLPILVNSAGGTIANISDSTNTWWQAQQVASGSFAARGMADMRNLRDLILQAGQGGAPMPDYVCVTRLIYELYEASQVSNIRYQGADVGDGAFGGMKFGGSVVEFDPNIATGELYMLSSDVLQLVVHSDANWTIGDFKEPVDQDMKVAKVIWMGNLVSLNRRRTGRLTGITA